MSIVNAKEIMVEALKGGYAIGAFNVTDLLQFEAVIDAAIEKKAPVIVRTRGHRLEGIWHAGSLMAGIIHLVRGMHVLVPRNMTQAAGFYNTLLRAEDPAIVVEVLNGYRQKEKVPDNIGEFTLSLGMPEIIRPGSDVTIVTYGACCRLAMEASELLRQTNIDAEVIDLRTVKPLDGLRAWLRRKRS